MIFVDESIQHDLDYICVGFVYCERSPDEHVRSAITHAGLVPGADEYKSGARMVNSAERRLLREGISSIVLQDCKLGVYIGPVDERPILLSAVAEAANQIVSRNQLPSPQVVFVDSGIDGKCDLGADSSIKLVPNCDSKTVYGIQLADYVAYHCSYLLKCTIEGTSKKVRVEVPHLPNSDEEVELDWLMRTELRRNFFVEYRDVERIAGDDWFFKLSGYGAYFSPKLATTVEVAARKTFDSMYFGCVW